MSQLSFAEQQPQIRANAAAAPVLTPRSPTPSTDRTPRPSVRQSFDSTGHVLFDFFMALGAFATILFYYLRVKSYLRFGAGLCFFFGAIGVTIFIPRPSLRPTVNAALTKMLFPIACFLFLLAETFLTWEKASSLDRYARDNNVDKIESIETRIIIMVLLTDFCIVLMFVATAFGLACPFLNCCYGHRRQHSLATLPTGTNVDGPRGKGNLLGEAERCGRGKDEERGSLECEIALGP